MSNDPYTDDRDEAYEVEYRDDEYSEVASDDAGATADERGGDGWWDEGLVGLLLVAGLALLLFPEPATSGIGVGLLSVGAALWVLDAVA